METIWTEQDVTKMKKFTPPNDNLLVDLSTVQIDTALPAEEKIVSFLRQIKNPYCFRVGPTTVHVAFENTDKTLTDRFTDMLNRC